MSPSQNKMVISDSEVGEVELSLRVAGQQPSNHPFSELGRQSSIFSLTLDEFQHTLCEGGKNFGSMNMDEFLTSIWNAEENQAINSNNNNQVSSQVHLSSNESSSSKGLASQPSLPRQGSLTLPAPLCRKTVDEVWSEIQRGQSSTSNVQNVDDNAGGTRRQPTFGEMTLEDFLVKAGVVREQCMAQPAVTPPPHHQPSQFGLYQTSNNPAIGSSFVSRPVGFIGTSAYQTMPPGLNDGKAGGGYRPAAPPLTAVCYSGKVATGGGYGPGKSTIGVAAPLERLCTNQVDYGVSQMEIGGVRGRQKIIDGPIEKIVERRQRRMIKNRESAARSRARKQAYTVELEAELNQLKQENAQLRQALVQLERKRKQQLFEEWRTKTQTKARRTKEKLRTMRRSMSCPL